jgi:UDP-2,3-diacylglucosamine hydrolase
MRALFVSDLHLSAERPDKLELFYRLLAHGARSADALYILGDLFEYWLGDDDDEAPHGDIVAALAAFTATATPLYVMHGNRDFLIGANFVAETGCRLLSDPTTIELGGNRILLMHGDLLCSKDLPYQQLRRTVQDPAWRKNVLSKSLDERRDLAAQMRAGSEDAKDTKDAYIMDVDTETVRSYMREHGVLRLIHGHTHRPDLHEFPLDGEPAYRYVLSDWYERDSVLVCEQDGWRQLGVEQYLTG